MNDPAKWDWADAASGVVMGVLGGMVSMFGWFSGKLGKVHDRIDSVHERVTANSSHIAVLQAQEVAKLQRMERIEDNLVAINEKQDRQMEVLMDLRGRDTYK